VPRGCSRASARSRSSMVTLTNARHGAAVERRAIHSRGASPHRRVTARRKGRLRTTRVRRAGGRDMGIDSRYDRRTFLKLAGATAAVAACGGATPAASAAPASSAAAATAAPVTGTISVYSALNESTNNEFFGAFRKAYPAVTVNVLPLAAAGELQTRIRTEKASPKADIFIGGSSEFHDPLGKEGLLEPYKSPNAASVDAAFKDANGNWTGWYIGIFGLAINKDRWSKEMAGKPMPSSWDDLLG